MSQNHRRPRVSARLLVLMSMASALALSSCVDGPAVPEEDIPASGPVLAIAPVFSLVGPGGAAVLSQGQADALDEAFTLVNRFRIVVRRASTNEVVATEIRTVEPNQAQYDFTLSVTAAPNEQFLVTLTAFEGETELFQATDITVTAARPATGGGQQPAPTTIPLRYSGPGATATEVRLDRAHLVLPPRGSGQLSASAHDQAGAAISGVPLAWTLSAPTVAAVDPGAPTAGARTITAKELDGLARLTVTGPSGIEAKAWVYVVGGTLAYVAGGDLLVRGPAGGEATPRGSGASAPAWSPNGGSLFYVSGGAVRTPDGGADLVGGNWPSVSPDGTKLAVDQGGTVVFVNTDGSNPTSGPKGSMPVWDSDATLLVAGGSIERVRAKVGGERSSVVAGSATAPARSGSSVAYVEGGALRVAGREGVVLEGVSGRPSWSPNGQWLVVGTASGLTVVPSDGSAPGAPLPGLAGASDPAFKPDGALTTHPDIKVDRFEPSEPSPGETVRIVGTGFDWIIPGNNIVTWPTRNGTTTPSTVSAATESYVETVMPRTVIAGQLRVDARGRTGFAFAINPKLGAIEISAKTPWDAPVPGVLGVVNDASGTEVVRGTTDADGNLLLAGLTPGDYTVRVTSADGFRLLGDASYSFPGLGVEAKVLALQLVPVVHTLRVTPEKLAVEVGSSIDVTLTGLDVTGAVIPEATTSRWVGGLPQVAATGTGFKGAITGVAPSTREGGSVLAVELNGKVFEIPVTVTSFITGTITQDPDPAPPSGASAQDGSDGGTTNVVETEAGVGYTIAVKNQATGAVAGTGVSASGGLYKVPGLFAGTYVVNLDPQRDRNPVPFTQTVTLGNETTTGLANFLMSRAPVAFINLDAGEATIPAIDGTLTIGVRSFDEDENELGGRPATFTSLNPSIATVDPNTGVVTAVSNGTVLIEVTVEAVTDTISVTVDQIATSITILGFDPETETLVPALDVERALVGETEQAFHEAKDANGHIIDPTHKTPTWTTSDAGIVSLSGDIADALSVGDAVITVQMDDVADAVTVEVYLLHSGDLFVTTGASSGNYMNPTDIAAARIGEVAGNLNIQSTSLTSLAGLESIYEVFGSVRVEFNTLLADVVGLMNLEVVGGDLRVWDNDALTTPPPPEPAKLEYIGGSLQLWGNALVTNLDAFDNLKAIEYDLEITDSPVFDDDDLLPNVEWIGGDIYFRDNVSFSSTGLLPGLIELGGAIRIEGGGIEIGFPSIQRATAAWIGGESYDNNILELLNLPALQCLSFDFYVYGNLVLHTVNVPNLQYMGAECTGAPPPIDVQGAARLSTDWRIDESHRDELRALRADRRGLDEIVREEFEELRAEADKRRSEHRLERPASGSVRGAPGERPTVDGPLARRALDLRPTFDGPSTPGTQQQRARIEASRQHHSGPREKAEERVKPAKASEPQRTYGSSNLYFSNNAALATLSFPVLEAVEGYVQFYYNDILSTVGFPVLNHIGGSLYVSYSHFTSLSFPALVDILGNLDLYYNYDPLTFSAPLLELIGYSLYVQYNQALADFVLPLLNSVGYDVDVCDNTWNSTLSLPALEYVGDDFYVEYNEGLTSVEVATTSLLDIGYDVEFYDNNGLQTINMPGLRSVYDDLTIDYNEGLVSVDIATTTDLTVGWDLEIYYNNYASEVPSTWTVNIPGLIWVDDDVEIWDNHGLVSVTLSTGNPASFNYWFEVEDNPDLEVFSAPQAVYIYDDLYFYNNPVLTSVSFPNLVTVDDDVYFDMNGTPGSFSVDFSSLTTVAYDFWFENNPGLASIIAPNLTNVGVDVWIMQNHDLTSIDLSSLATIGDDFGIYDNDALTTLSLPSLTNASYYMDISYNDALTSVSAPSLTDLAPPALPVQGAQGVVASFGDMWIVSNLAMTSFDFSSLAGVNYVYMYGNNALTTLGTFGPLNPTTMVEIEYHDLLGNLAGLSSVTGTLSSVDIDNNPSLSDVGGLANIGSSAAGDPVITGDLRFNENTALPCTAVPALFETLEGLFSGTPAVGGTYSNTNTACPPTITDISPSSVTAGTPTVMTITGTNLHHTKDVTVCFLAFVDNANLTTSADGTTVTVSVTWDGSESGSRCVNVNTPQGTVTGNVTVNPPSELSPMPDEPAALEPK